MNVAGTVCIINSSVIQSILYFYNTVLPLPSHHHSKSNFRVNIILGEWETGSLPLWFFSPTYVFLKQRHLVLGAAQDRLAKKTLRVLFSHPGPSVHSAVPCLEDSVGCLQPRDIADKCPYGLMAFRPIKFLFVLASSLDMLAKTGGRGVCVLFFFFYTKRNIHT